MFKCNSILVVFASALNTSLRVQVFTPFPPDIDVANLFGLSQFLLALLSIAKPARVQPILRRRLSVLSM